MASVLFWHLWIPVQHTLGHSFEQIFLELLHITIGFVCCVNVLMLIIETVIGKLSPTTCYCFIAVDIIVSLIHLCMFLWKRLFELAFEMKWKPKSARVQSMESPPVISLVEVVSLENALEMKIKGAKGLANKDGDLTLVEISADNVSLSFNSKWERIQLILSVFIWMKLLRRTFRGLKCRHIPFLIAYLILLTAVLADWWLNLSELFGNVVRIIGCIIFTLVFLVRNFKRLKAGVWWLLNLLKLPCCFICCCCFCCCCVSKFDQVREKPLPVDPPNQPQEEVEQVEQLVEEQQPKPSVTVTEANSNKSEDSDSGIAV